MIFYSSRLIIESIDLEFRVSVPWGSYCHTSFLFCENQPPSGEVEAIQAHYLIPQRNKVVQELFLGILASIDFRQGTELGV